MCTPLFCNICLSYRCEIMPPEERWMQPSMSRDSYVRCSTHIIPVCFVCACTHMIFQMSTSVRQTMAAVLTHASTPKAATCVNVTKVTNWTVQTKVLVLVSRSNRIVTPKCRLDFGYCSKTQSTIVINKRKVNVLII